MERRKVGEMFYRNVYISVTGLRGRTAKERIGDPNTEFGFGHVEFKVLRRRPGESKRKPGDWGRDVFVSHLQREERRQGRVGEINRRVERRAGAQGKNLEDSGIY